MIVWGGWPDAVNLLNTGGRYDPANDSWAVGGTNTTGAPTARISHTAVWTGARMIVWGGGALLGTGGQYGILSLYVKN